MARTLTAALRGEYGLLFSRMSIRPERHEQIARLYRIAKNATAQTAYRQVESAIGVPWYVTALIHNLESSQRFDAHLHNGDTLRQRTTRVPKGRPLAPEPPYDWHQSAIDALTQKSLHAWTDWSAAGIAFVLERYNGFGYRNHYPHVPSPYLWSYSNVYRAGKYVTDGRFSEGAVSQQCGGMVLLRYIMDHEPDVARTIRFQTATNDDGVSGAAASFPAIEGPEGTAAPEGTRQTAPSPQFPGRYLLVPIEGDPAVLLVQKRLQALRIDTGLLDGDYGEITQQAVRLFQSRSATPAGEPLEIDGIVGPQTWAALFGDRALPSNATIGLHDKPSSLALAVVDCAASQVGVREAPFGSNRGPMVDEYIRSVGLDPARDSYPWCMCFVHWCYAMTAKSLGVANVCPRSASVHLAWQAAERLGDRAVVIAAAEARRDPGKVVPGMVFFIDTGGGRGHVGIVASHTNTNLETIEGNTNDNGSREGIGVFRRSRRRISDISLGFAGFWS